MWSDIVATCIKSSPSLYNTLIKLQRSISNTKWTKESWSNENRGKKREKREKKQEQYKAADLESNCRLVIILKSFDYQTSVLMKSFMPC